ncbi:MULTISPECIES: hypothetical protein [unclassified Microcoleus]|uniref:hypothetical protein n=1 Tax=unclassified Microcoleus TaxID=2642155 RepID=UPI002FD3AB1A
MIRVILVGAKPTPGCPALTGVGTGALPLHIFTNDLGLLYITRDAEEERIYVVNILGLIECDDDQLHVIQSRSPASLLMIADRTGKAIRLSAQLCHFILIRAILKQELEKSKKGGWGCFGFL